MQFESIVRSLSDSPMFALEHLIALSEPPALWTPADPLFFWDDPYISSQLLAAHLAQDTEAASRPAATIRQIVDHLVTRLDLGPDSRVLDLGCGPGLYAVEFAQRGIPVDGVDGSRRSITYAREQAAARDLPLTFRHMDYLMLDDTATADLVLLIYGDYCVMPPAKRARLLGSIRRALRPGGTFVFDVTTPRLRERARLPQQWSASASGFWRPGPHLLLERSFQYAGDIELNQYIVIDENGHTTVYRHWFQDYDRARITDELAANGFVVREVWADLTGAPYDPDSEWIALAAQPGDPA